MDTFLELYFSKTCFGLFFGASITFFIAVFASKNKAESNYRVYLLLFFGINSLIIFLNLEPNHQSGRNRKEVSATPNITGKKVLKNPENESPDFQEIYVKITMPAQYTIDIRKANCGCVASLKEVPEKNEIQENKITPTTNQPEAKPTAVTIKENGDCRDKPGLNACNCKALTPTSSRNIATRLLVNGSDGNQSLK